MLIKEKATNQTWINFNWNWTNIFAHLQNYSPTRSSTFRKLFKCFQIKSFIFAKWRNRRKLFLLVFVKTSDLQKFANKCFHCLPFFCVCCPFYSFSMEALNHCWLLFNVALRSCDFVEASFFWFSNLALLEFFPMWPNLTTAHAPH